MTRTDSSGTVDGTVSQPDGNLRGLLLFPEIRLKVDEFVLRVVQVSSAELLERPGGRMKLFTVVFFLASDPPLMGCVAVRPHPRTVHLGFCYCHRPAITTAQTSSARRPSPDWSLQLSSQMVRNGGTITSAGSSRRPAPAPRAVLPIPRKQDIRTSPAPHHRCDRPSHRHLGFCYCQPVQHYDRANVAVLGDVTGTGAYSSAVTWTATGGTIHFGRVFTPSGAGTASCIAIPRKQDIRTSPAPHPSL